MVSELVNTERLPMPRLAHFTDMIAFSCIFKKETPFGNEIYLSKYPVTCSIRIYIVLAVYSKTLGVVVCLFHAPIVERCPLEMNCTFPNTLTHVVPESVWLWGLYPKP